MTGVRRAAALAGVAIVSFAGCSGGGDDLDAYCDVLAEVLEIDGRMAEIDPTDAAAADLAAERFSSAIDRAAELAPNEIDDDVEVLATWATAILEARAAMGADDLADVTRLEDAVEGLPDPTAAIGRIRAHGERECRVALPSG